MNSWNVGTAVILAAALLFGTPNGTYGVDRSTFKTCEQSSFCKWHRDLPPNLCAYSIDPKTVKLTTTSIFAHMDEVGVEVPNKLTLELFPLQEGILRLKLNEAKPLSPRYEPVDVLVGQGTPAAFETRPVGNGLVIKFGSVEAYLRYSTFRLDVWNNGVYTFSVNPRGLLRMQPGTLASADVLGEQSDEIRAKVSVSYEESFKGHRDSRKRGPISVGLDVSFAYMEHVYGIPEHAHDLSLPTTRYPINPKGRKAIFDDAVLD